MAYQVDASAIREELSPEQRAADMHLTIDPGFVHYRKIETLIGTDGMRHIDDSILNLPPMPDYRRHIRVAHIYTRALMALRKAWDVPSLGELIAAGKGYLFCSTVTVLPAPEVYTSDRAVSRIVIPGVESPTVELHYSIEHFVADTTRCELANGDDGVAVVAQFHRREGDKLVFYPLLIGGPWLEPGDNPVPFDGPEWYSHDYFEHFIEDVDEFARARTTKTPDDFSVMKRITEFAFKTCLAEILGDNAHTDCGGEMSDHFAAHLHLSGKQTTAAFLLKGPGNGFSPMTLRNLGKNSDQIYRLAQEPAQLLIVQHCHDITPPVRATLRAFAVQPGRTRRYCLIDGRDSLRLLTAHNKVSSALELSNGSN